MPTKKRIKNKVYLLLMCGAAICFVACDKDNLSFAFSQSWNTLPFDDSGATKFLNVAAVSMESNQLPEVNRDKIAYFIDKIKSEQPNVRLILFPEIALGYYYMPSNPLEYQESIAETVPGVTTNILSAKAVEHQIYISIGMAEKHGAEMYNAQVLIAPDGTIASVYHKQNLTSWDIESGFKAGDKVNVDIIDNIKVTTIICSDNNSVKIHKQIHELGAELVLLPEATPTNLSDNWKMPSFTYSWTLQSSRIGNEEEIFYRGLLYLIAPSGEYKVKKIGQEGYIYGEVKVW